MLHLQQVDVGGPVRTEHSGKLCFCLGSGSLHGSEVEGEDSGFVAGGCIDRIGAGGRVAIAGGMVLDELALEAYGH